jgi:hypothetical protein
MVTVSQVAVMPLFYFHLDGDSRSPQSRAADLSDLDTAIAFAETIVREVGKTVAPEDLIYAEVVILDEAGNEVKRVPLSSPTGPLH